MGSTELCLQRTKRAREARRSAHTAVANLLKSSCPNSCEQSAKRRLDNNGRHMNTSFPKLRAARQEGDVAQRRELQYPLLRELFLFSSLGMPRIPSHVMPHSRAGAATGD